MTVIHLDRFRTLKALQIFDQVLGFPYSIRLRSGERCSFSLTKKQRSLLSPTIRFLHQEQLVYVDGFDEEDDLEPHDLISLRAIPLPRLLYMFDS